MPLMMDITQPTGLGQVMVGVVGEAQLAAAGGGLPALVEGKV